MCIDGFGFRVKNGAGLEPEAKLDGSDDEGFTPKSNA